jgi:tetratricopeptide (TPR) repeat protein
MKLSFRVVLLGAVLFSASFSAAQQELPNAIGALAAPRKLAFCIGAGNYQGIGKLRFAAKDAIDFSNTLKTQFGYKDHEVVLLADEKGYVSPDSKSINDELNKILKSPDLESGDQVILYFSGHGIGLSSGDYWLPNDVDSSSYSFKGISIKSVISRFAAKGIRNLVVISDACRAGAKTQNFGEELIQLGKITNIAVMLGCQPGQKSYELERRQNGAFTYSLIKSLKNEKLVEPVTGALWASKIGQSTAELSLEFTKSEYGANAQKPAIFADRYQDVAFSILSSKVSTVDELLKQIPGNVQQDQVNLVLTYNALNFLKNKDYQSALKCFQTIENVGGINGTHAIGFASVLKALGREPDWQRVVARNYLGKTLTKRSAVAICLTSPDVVGSSAYSAALQRLKDAFESPMDELEIVHGFAKQYGVYSSEKLAALVADCIKREVQNDPRKPIWQAYLKGLKGDKDGSIADLEKLMAAGNTNELTFEFLAQAYLDAEDGKQLMEICQKASTIHETNPKFLYLQFAQLLKENKRAVVAEKMVDWLKKHGYQGWMDFFATLLAEEIAPVLKAGEEKLKETPDHYNLLTWQWMKQVLTTLDFLTPLPLQYGNAIKQNPDAVFIPFSLLTDWMLNCERLEIFKNSDALPYYRLIAANQGKYLESYIGSPRANDKFCQQLLRIGAIPQMFYFCDIDWPQADPKSQNHPLYLQNTLIASLNFGRLDEARNVFAQSKELEIDDPRMNSRMAAHLALTKRYSDYDNLIARPKKKLRHGYDIACEALRILDSKGPKAANEYMVANNRNDDRPDDGAVLLGMTAYFLANPTEPPTVLLAKLLVCPAEFTDIKILCSERLIPVLTESKNPEIQKYGPMLKESLYLFSGNHLLKESKSLSGYPLKDFKGEYDFELRALKGQPFTESEIHFTIDDSGKLEGKYDKYDIKGQIDIRGNIDASIYVNSKPTTKIIATIPPAVIAKQNPKLVRFIFLASKCLLLEYQAKS